MVAMATMATKDINPQPISHHQYQYQALDFRFCISIHTTPSCPLSTLIVTHYSTVVHSCGDWLGVDQSLPLVRMRMGSGE